MANKFSPLLFGRKTDETYQRARSYTRHEMETFVSRIQLEKVDEDDDLKVCELFGAKILKGVADELMNYFPADSYRNSIEELAHRVFNEAKENNKPTLREAQDRDYDTEYFRESNFKKIDEEFDKLTDNYMETESPGEFLGSEILAAANKLIYRYFNDGDVLNKGYGKETCNPAYRFLKQTLSPKNANGITASHYDKYEDFLKAIEYYVVWEFGRNPELSRTKNDKGSYLKY